MIGVIEAIGLLIIIGVNTAVAALATRFFRVRLSTRFGSAIYAILLTPLPMVAVILLLSGVLGLGPNLGGTYTVMGLTILVPMAVGIAFDFFWMPAPDEVDLPEEYSEQGG